MPEDIVIFESKYCGPDGIVNGGYVAGVLAGRLEGPAEVTLKRPAPLEAELTVGQPGREMAVLKQGEIIIAEANTTMFDLDVPEPPSFAEAESAAGNYSGFEFHPAPNCFVCGPRRRDGLKVFAGKPAGRDYVVAPWVPQRALATGAGKVMPEFVWAVLDCPGAAAFVDGKLLNVLLGRLALQSFMDVLPDNRYVVIGWLIASEGRKYFTGTALYSAEGELCACAKATWIRIS